VKFFFQVFPPPYTQS
ncbi:unnamed protein product, partial [Allacma fusca]